MMFQLIKPSQTFSRIHGNSGVTDIRCHGDDVYSCGRNGRYCQFTVDNDHRLQLVSSNKVGIGIILSSVCLSVMLYIMSK